MLKAKQFSIIKEEWKTETKRLPITDDYIFKRVFAYKGNESVLKYIDIKKKSLNIKKDIANEYMDKLIESLK